MRGHTNKLRPVFAYYKYNINNKYNINYLEQQCDMYNRG